MNNPSPWIDLHTTEEENQEIVLQQVQLDLAVAGAHDYGEDDQSIREVQDQPKEKSEDAAEEKTTTYKENFINVSSSPDYGEDQSISMAPPPKQPSLSSAQESSIDAGQADQSVTIAPIKNEEVSKQDLLNKISELELIIKQQAEQSRSQEDKIEKLEIIIENQKNEIENISKISSLKLATDESNQQLKQQMAQSKDKNTKRSVGFDDV